MRLERGSTRMSTEARTAEEVTVGGQMVLRNPDRPEDGWRIVYNHLELVDRHSDGTGLSARQRADLRWNMPALR
jgi:hypothetical protein